MHACWGDSWNPSNAGRISNKQNAACMGLEGCSSSITRSSGRISWHWQRRGQEDLLVDVVPLY